MKRISREVHPYEAEIGELFSSGPFKSHPRNHCVPLLEVLDVPDEEDKQLLVMPLLRLFDDPRFETVGELLGFLYQFFEVREAYAARSSSPDGSSPRGCNSCTKVTSLIGE